MEQLKKKIEKLSVQFIKFGMVGVLNTFISLSVYYILTYFDVHYVIANTAGFLCSVVNAFYWNGKYVFKNKQEQSVARAFLKVFISYGGSFLLSTILITLFIEVLMISKWIAPLLRLVVTIPINFVVNKLWAFKDHG